MLRIYGVGMYRRWAPMGWLLRDERAAGPEEYAATFHLYS